MYAPAAKSVVGNPYDWLKEVAPVIDNRVETAPSGLISFIMALAAGAPTGVSQENVYDTLSPLV